MSNKKIVNNRRIVSARRKQLPVKQVPVKQLPVKQLPVEVIPLHSQRRTSGIEGLRYYAKTKQLINLGVIVAPSELSVSQSKKGTLLRLPKEIESCFDTFKDNINAIMVYVFTQTVQELNETLKSLPVYRNANLSTQKSHGCSIYGFSIGSGDRVDSVDFENKEISVIKEIVFRDIAISKENLQLVFKKLQFLQIIGFKNIENELDFTGCFSRSLHLLELFEFKVNFSSINEAFSNLRALDCSYNAGKIKDTKPFSSIRQLTLRDLSIELSDLENIARAFPNVLRLNLEICKFSQKKKVIFDDFLDNSGVLDLSEKVDELTISDSEFTDLKQLTITFRCIVSKNDFLSLMSMFFLLDEMVLNVLTEEQKKQCETWIKEETKDLCDLANVKIIVQN